MDAKWKSYEQVKSGKLLGTPCKKTFRTTQYFYFFTSYVAFYFITYFFATNPGILGGHFVWRWGHVPPGAPPSYAPAASTTCASPCCSSTSRRPLTLLNSVLFEMHLRTTMSTATSSRPARSCMRHPAPSSRSILLMLRICPICAAGLGLPGYLTDVKTVVKMTSWREKSENKYKSDRTLKFFNGVTRACR